MLLLGQYQPQYNVFIGAGGRGRTDTDGEVPRILSPVRLPFRHTGKIDDFDEK